MWDWPKICVGKKTSNSRCFLIYTTPFSGDIGDGLRWGVPCHSCMGQLINLELEGSGQTVCSSICIIPMRRIKTVEWMMLEMLDVICGRLSWDIASQALPHLGPVPMCLGIQCRRWMVVIVAGSRLEPLSHPYAFYPKNVVLWCLMWPSTMTTGWWSSRPSHKGGCGFKIPKSNRHGKHSNQPADAALALLNKSWRRSSKCKSENHWTFYSDPWQNILPVNLPASAVIGRTCPVTPNATHRRKFGIVWEPKLPYPYSVHFRSCKGGLPGPRIKVLYLLWPRAIDCTPPAAKVPVSSGRRASKWQCLNDGANQHGGP